MAVDMFSSLIKKKKKKGVGVGRGLQFRWKDVDCRYFLCMKPYAQQAGKRYWDLSEVQKSEIKWAAVWQANGCGPLRLNWHYG